VGRGGLQKSVFTLAGDSFLPLDEQFKGRLVHDGIFVKIERPAAGFDEVEDNLSVNGLRAGERGDDEAQRGKSPPR
jgi:hypothetical protein